MKMSNIMTSYGLLMLTLNLYKNRKNMTNK
jgi:hypothetical protein